MLSVLVASSGRPTLRDAVSSIVPQLGHGDELIVDVNNDAPWGHRARNRMMPRARQGFLMFLDDDDLYLPGALTVVRAACVEKPNDIHIFRMIYDDGSTLWREPELCVGNVSTQMFAVPRWAATVSTWTDRYEGDFDFIQRAAMDARVSWHHEVIAHVRPAPDVIRP